MTKAIVSESPIDFIMVSMVAQAHYVDYCEYVGIEGASWDDLSQDTRDHYIRQALKTFGIESKETQ